MTTRRAEIEKLLQQEPGDPFLRYSLALEYEKSGDREEAMAMLRELMQADPPYVAAFHMAGRWLVDDGKLEQARAVLREGIEWARRENRQLDASEMADLLASIGGSQQ